jgi:4a-hydroxytetrahydrobiopterin dehydratase
MSLAEKKCIPCEDPKLPPMSCDEARKLYEESQTEITGWGMNDACSRLSSVKNFANFVSAMEFVNKVADVAEDAGHHPNISINYNEVILDLWTHSIGGLSENDFIVAARINQV